MLVALLSVMKLLTVGDAKTTKGEELGILTGILYLNPAVKTSTLCPYASEECKALCLVSSGRAEIYPMVMQARSRKSTEFLSNRSAFIDQLRLDIKVIARRAKRKGMVPAIRLNGTSDILWERLSGLLEEFPEIQFYDYTKVPLKYRRMPANYHLTFSFSGHNWEDCIDAIAQGVNVAIVFSGAIPSTYKGLEVVDGTTHDVRFLDSIRGGVVGLCAKGSKARKAEKQGSAFIVKA